MTETKQQTLDITKSSVLDQFALVDLVDVVTSSRLMKILRHVRKHSPIGEGALAGRCMERMFLPEWPLFINKLLEFGYIKVESKAFGNARSISLTPLGEQFMEFRTGPKETAEEQLTDQPQG